MTVLEFKKMVNDIPAADDNCLVLMSVKTDLLGIFAFEVVCPGVSGMVELGECPPYMKEQDIFEGKPARVLLIAPHSMHDEEEHEPTSDKLN